jgi:hypothetical protein
MATGITPAMTESKPAPDLVIEKHRARVQQTLSTVQELIATADEWGKPLTVGKTLSELREESVQSRVQRRKGFVPHHEK